MENILEGQVNVGSSTALNEKSGKVWLGQKIIFF
jgi:hypothetical protein